MKIYSKRNPILHDLFRSSEPFALLVDKSPDWTSFDVVAKLRALWKIKKVGHAGTLDPFATGLLILCFNKATKSIEDFQSKFKIYDSVVELGKETDTCDLTGKIVKESNEIPDNLDLDSINKSFTGKIMQVPPIFSAIKKDGKRLYDLARKGIETEIAAREITVFDLYNCTYDKPFFSFTAKVSKGTYIRSLARDIGTFLSCFGYLKSLRRTAIGDYSVDDAYTLQELIELTAKLKPVEKL
ncbi:MAG: tRNA pseudouridine(55) synthase TruB [Candidatus Delongbacteria bacterium]|nr:tRNA pseudouridine(55) synthase TruB [Candidatus Delongbacteria bacterium]MBN2834191.1 tRNA pseudouridine(55) synthase TruB [Candidatus Delongbacteria bacterium]